MGEKGLTSVEAKELQLKYGKNELSMEKSDKFFKKIFEIICEPMFLLLLIAATIYFVLGDPKDGIIMLIFVFAIIMIDIIQEWKTDKTLKALKKLTEPKITVLRDNEKIQINSTDLVPGDIMYIYEGVKIPADGFVVSCNGLKVDESSLTGESNGVWKTSKKFEAKGYWKEDYCYQGTLVIQGTGTIKVDKIGNMTEYGKIGYNMSKVPSTKTPLENQTNELVKYCAYFALVLFFLVSIITFFELKTYEPIERLTSSILSGVTLAMAMIPEEFPVVLMVFLSMGAWRLAKKNSLVKKMSSVETLGAISVLCVDKTGTITKNKMEVSNIFYTCSNEEELIKKMCLSCEENTYDPMEKAMFNYAKNFGFNKSNIFDMERIKSFPFSNETKIVGSAYLNGKNIILTAKGSPENILKICNISENDLQNINKEIKFMQEKGLRVIAIASQNYKKENQIKNELSENVLNFDGLIGLIDPPRENIYKDIELCEKSGIKVVMITGDNGVTAAAIAKQIGMKNKNVITGEMIDKMSFAELKEKVKDVSIFSRVIPKHKMQIVKAFQSNGEVVAMTGDGVNDAPALKQAEIGIAMGKKGSEVSTEAADLILLDDNFTTIIDTIKDGRRIYDNIKKSIGYIFVIHIPIALISLMCPLLGINPNDIMLLPIHIVLLELLIDPTCSIILERQPAENNIMTRKPRNTKEKIVNKNLLKKSILQGLIIFINSFGIYYSCMQKTNNIELSRTMGLSIIMISNVFLVLVNSSEYDYVYQLLKKVLKDKMLLIINFAMIFMIFLVISSPLSKYLKLTNLNFKQFIFVIIVSFVSTFWYELIKFAYKK